MIVIIKKISIFSQDEALFKTWGDDKTWPTLVTPEADWPSLQVEFCEHNELACSTREQLN